MILYSIDFAYLTPPDKFRKLRGFARGGNHCRMHWAMDA